MNLTCWISLSKYWVSILKTQYVSYYWQKLLNRNHMGCQNYHHHSTDHLDILVNTKSIDRRHISERIQLWYLKLLSLTYHRTHYIDRSNTQKTWHTFCSHHPRDCHHYHRNLRLIFMILSNPSIGLTPSFRDSLKSWGNVWPWNHRLLNPE